MLTTVNEIIVIGEMIWNRQDVQGSQLMSVQYIMATTRRCGEGTTVVFSTGHKQEIERSDLLLVSYNKGELPLDFPYT